MKFTTLVALLLLSFKVFAVDLSASLSSIESEWAHIYYNTSKFQQDAAFNELAKKTEALCIQYPHDPEPLFWKAVIIASHAELEDGFTALKSVNTAKDLLIETLKRNPTTANGSAYVTLGTLYYMVPRWPIGFGDYEKAEQMFKAALKINPNAIDANYFYGDFLLSTNKPKEAQTFFETAIKLTARQGQSFADQKLQEEAKLALMNAKDRKLNSVKNAFLSLFTSASLN